MIRKSPSKETSKKSSHISSLPPSIVECRVEYSTWCAQAIAYKLIGKVITDLNGASTQEEQDDVGIQFHDITNREGN